MTADKEQKSGARKLRRVPCCGVLQAKRGKRMRQAVLVEEHGGMLAVQLVERTSKCATKTFR